MDIVIHIDIGIVIGRATDSVIGKDRDIDIDMDMNMHC